MHPQLCADAFFFRISLIDARYREVALECQLLPNPGRSVLLITTLLLYHEPQQGEASQMSQQALILHEHSTDHVCSVDCVHNVYDQKNTSLIQNMHISGRFLTGA